MAVPMDQSLHAKYVHVLSLWEVTGYINWEETAVRFIRRELEGYTIKLFGKLMYEHVNGGGKIHQIAETRLEWLEWPFHYDLYVPVGTRKVYIETRFVDEKHPDDCGINVVNAHDP